MWSPGHRLAQRDAGHAPRLWRLLVDPPGDGTPSCIDSELQSIDWNSNPTAASNPPVQSDSQGAIYYRGQGQNGSVLRKYLNGVKTDLINGNIMINDFGCTTLRGMMPGSSATAL